jgi:hypothetical protein
MERVFHQQTLEPVTSRILEIHCQASGQFRQIADNDICAEYETQTSKRQQTTNIAERAQLLVARMQAEILIHPYCNIDEIFAWLNEGATEDELMEEWKIMFGHRQRRRSEAGNLRIQLKQEGNDGQGVDKNTVLSHLYAGWSHERISAACQWKRETQDLFSKLQLGFGC